MMNKFPRNLLFLIMLTCMTANVLRGNNLRFENVQCSQGKVEFDISWDHSFNLDQGPRNHDAIWIFAKYSDLDDGLWQHLHFDTDPIAHSSASNSGLELEVDENGLGVMLKNAQVGSRNIVSEHIELKFSSNFNLSKFRFRIFGIEMIYIPESPFWIGDAASNNYLGNSLHLPYFVDNEDEIPQGALVSSGDFSPDAAISADFPKGFGGFYLMKYEIGQEQYRDFLNSLNYQQQQARTNANPSSAVGTAALGSLGTRNGIVIKTPGIEGQKPAVYALDHDRNFVFDNEKDGQNRACNWLNWGDLTAYLDWACLRPMTEFEFEKAARGPIAPLSNEFAWGTAASIDANTLIYDGTRQETVTEQAYGNVGLAVHGYSGPSGPLRAGFGSNENSNRLQAGAGYFGNMELSGNVWEMCVQAFGPSLSFQGILGDGTLDANGNANVSDWPIDGGFKGGAWNSGLLPGFNDLAISDRFYIGTSSLIRRNTSGGRGAR